MSALDFPRFDRRLFRAAASHAAATLASRQLQAQLDGPQRQRDTGRDTALARDQAVAMVTHDLRNPLGVILMQAAMLARAADGDPEQRGRRIATLARAATRMKTLLDQSMAFYNVRGGQLTLAMGTHAPADLVGRAVEASRAQAEERRIVLEAELSPGLPDLACDAEQLAQVFAQLVGGALQVVADGGSVAIRALHDDGGVVFSVRDDGPYIGEEDLSQLFECAWRGEPTPSGRGALGLAIAKGIVEAHGGKIWAASERDGGNTFCFALPAARA